MGCGQSRAAAAAIVAETKAQKAESLASKAVGGGNRPTSFKQQQGGSLSSRTQQPSPFSDQDNGAANDDDDDNKKKNQDTNDAAGGGGGGGGGDEEEEEDVLDRVPSPKPFGTFSFGGRNQNQTNNNSKRRTLGGRHKSTRSASSASTNRTEKAHNRSPKRKGSSSSKTTTRRVVAEEEDDDEEEENALLPPPPPTITRMSHPSNELLDLLQRQLLLSSSSSTQKRKSVLLATVWEQVISHCESDPTSASFQDLGNSLATPLHLACRLLDVVYEAQASFAAAGGGGGGGPTREGGPDAAAAAADDDDDDDNDNDNDSDDKDANAAVFATPRTPVATTGLKTTGSSSSSFRTPRAVDAVRALIKACPEAVSRVDDAGYTPLHYSLSPSGQHAEKFVAAACKDRAAVVQTLVAADYEVAMEYLSHRRDITLLATARQEQKDGADSDADADSPPSGVTALYKVICCLPDDFAVVSRSPTVALVKVVHEATITSLVSVSNAADFDKPLSLLYRRFSRQFDNSEKFFAGDNSRPEILHYRQEYKTAAMNTWTMIQLLLQPNPAHAPHPPVPANPFLDDSQRRLLLDGGAASPNPALPTAAGDFSLVHAAVALPDCPPDLLRYIVETNPEQVKEADRKGNLPLHIAAATLPLGSFHHHHQTLGASHPSRYNDALAYHSKFVVDELLFSYPDGAATLDAHGQTPLEIALEAGKTWFAGGIKSLYDLYPNAMEQVDLNQYVAIRRALSFASRESASVVGGTGASGGSAEDSDKGEESTTASSSKASTIAKEDYHDAIMLVQKKDANLAEIVSIMWANEEEGGIQLLGCMAIGQLALDAAAAASLTRLHWLALQAVVAVVNAMKNHPNEPAVQERACSALATLAVADGYREVSFAASGAIASIVAAMQAHVSDAIVQQEACAALCAIVQSADRATVVASVSGFTALQNALGAHSHVVGVQREACRALDALTSYYKDANLPVLPGVQTAPLLQAAAQEFPLECKAAAEAVLARLS